MFDLEKAKAASLARLKAELFPAPKGPGGPKTEAGKQRTRLNSYKHGLTGQIHVFTAEEHEAYAKHCQSIVDALAPVGTLEQQLAQSIAEGKWRLNRAHALESGIFALGQIADESEPEVVQREIDQPQISQTLSQARTWLDDGKSIQLLSLYEQRIQRCIAKDMAELRTLRAERLAARQQAIEEAVLLSQLAKTKGETYHPPADFPSRQFVFSSAEIGPLIARKQRLDEARALPKTRINPNPGIQMPAAA